MVENIQKGEFSLRDMRDQFSSVLNMGPLSQVVSMIPGLSSNLIPKGREKESTARIKRFLCIMDSMTDEELDCIKPMSDLRLLRIAKGSGCRPEEVAFLLEEHKKFAKMVEQFGKMKLNNQTDLKNLNRNPK